MMPDQRQGRNVSQFGLILKFAEQDYHRSQLRSQLL